MDIKKIIADELRDGKCHLTDEDIITIYESVIKIPTELLILEAKSKGETYGISYTVVDVFNDIIIDRAVAWNNQDIYYVNK